jgi:putative two-component system response regulator
VSAYSRTPLNAIHAPTRVLVIDDSAEQVELLCRVLSREGYACISAPDGRHGLDLCASGVDVVLLDIELPDIDGLTICRQLKASPETALTPVLIMTGRAEEQGVLEALQAGADDFLAKPLRIGEVLARVASAARTKRHVDGLDNAAASILMLAATIEARDPYTNGHCQRLAEHSTALGERIGLDADDLIALRHGGYLHDLGKIALPDSVLFKPGPLSAEEFALVKMHPVVGDRLCTPLRSLERVRPIIRYHHETLDGAGYPEGLRGSAIPLLAQVMGIVDVYDAVTSKRPYRDALSPDAAWMILSREVSDGKRDATLVRDFRDLMQLGSMPSAAPPPWAEALAMDGTMDWKRASL